MDTTSIWELSRWIERGIREVARLQKDVPPSNYKLGSSNYKLGTPKYVWAL